MALVALPRHDLESRAHLDNLARRGAPVVLARERALPVPGVLGPLLPGGAVQRGTVVSVAGETGAGSTSVALGLAAAATVAGEWAAAVDPSCTFGGFAAAAAGVELARFVMVRGVPIDRWAVVVAALLDGVSVVVADVPRGLHVSDARRLMARARERSAVLVAVGAWPVEAALRLRAEGGAWSGLGVGDGELAGRALRVRVEGRGAPARVRMVALVG